MRSSGRRAKNEEFDPDANYENSRRSEDADNYGYPPDARQFGNVRPASEDPYGDRADEEGLS